MMNRDGQKFSKQYKDIKQNVENYLFLKVQILHFHLLINITIIVLRI